jgi:hypothetical protein
MTERAGTTVPTRHHCASSGSRPRTAARSPHEHRDRPTLAQLEQAAPFEVRHIGPDADAQAKMLAVLGYGSLEDLTAAAVPEDHPRARGPRPPAAGSEPEAWPSCARWLTATG